MRRHMGVTGDRICGHGGYTIAANEGLPLSGDPDSTFLFCSLHNASRQAWKGGLCWKEEQTQFDRYAMATTRSRMENEYVDCLCRKGTVSWCTKRAKREYAASDFRHKME